MPRAKQLSDEERGMIKAFYDSGFSNREIARRLKRSEGAVRYYLKSPTKEERKNAKEDPKKLRNE